MVSTTADAHAFDASTAEAPARRQPAADDSSVGYATPNGLYLAVVVAGALLTFALPFVLTAMGPH